MLYLAAKAESPEIESWFPSGKLMVEPTSRIVLGLLLRRGEIRSSNSQVQTYMARLTCLIFTFLVIGSTGMV